MHEGGTRSASAGAGSQWCPVQGVLGDDALDGLHCHRRRPGARSAAPIHRQLERALEDPRTRGVLLELGGVRQHGAARGAAPAHRTPARRPASRWSPTSSTGGGRGDFYLAAARGTTWFAQKLCSRARLRAERRYYQQPARRLGRADRPQLVRRVQVGVSELQRRLDPDRGSRGDRAQPGRQAQELFVSAVVRRPPDRARTAAHRARRPAVEPRSRAARAWSTRSATARTRCGYWEALAAHRPGAAHCEPRPHQAGAARVDAAHADRGGVRDRRDRDRPAAATICFLGPYMGSVPRWCASSSARSTQSGRARGGAARREPGRLRARLEPDRSRRPAAQARDRQAADRLDGRVSRAAAATTSRRHGDQHLRRPLHPHRLDRRASPSSPSFQAGTRSTACAGRLRARRATCAACPTARDWDRAMQASADSSIMDFYRAFVSKVADGRADWSAVDAVAQGGCRWVRMRSAQSWWTDRRPRAGDQPGRRRAGVAPGEDPDPSSTGGRKPWLHPSGWPARRWPRVWSRARPRPDANAVYWLADADVDGRRKSRTPARARGRARVGAATDGARRHGRGAACLASVAGARGA